MTEGFYAGRRIAVTGAAGSVGAELVRQLVAAGAREVRCLDNNESGLFELEHAFYDEGRVACFYTDIRSEDKLRHFFKGCEQVFHAAALKHVPFSERSPFETVQTNILGVQNIIRAAQATGIERVLFTSSDKAVNPTNVMGTSKLMGERLITAANALIQQAGQETIFASTRFGNVGGSRGSVIPLFCNQIARGGPVTVTSREMTRFVMTLSESVAMVMETMALAEGGEVFVLKMPVVQIGDLADAMVDILAPIYGRRPADIEIREVGPRPGEKFYEELTSDEETRRTYQLSDLFVVLPAFRNIYGGIAYDYLTNLEPGIDRPYVSHDEPKMTRSEIETFLLEPAVLPDEVREILLRKRGQEPPVRLAKG